MDNTVPTFQLRPTGRLIRAAWTVFNQHFPALAGIAVIGVIPDILLSLSGPANRDPNNLVTGWSFLAILVAIFVALWMATAIYYFLTKQPTTTNPFIVYRDSVHLVGRVFSTGALIGVLLFALVLVLAVPIIFFAGASVFKILTDATVSSGGLLNSGFAFLIGGLVMLVPILYLSVRWQFSTLLVVTDNIANWSAMKRSAALVRGRWWAVFGRFFLFGFLIGIVVAIISALLGPLAKTFPNGASILQSVMTNIIIGPMVACFTVQLFMDLRQAAGATPVAKIE